jgi:hypothetical protein
VTISEVGSSRTGNVEWLSVGRRVQWTHLLDCATLTSVDWSDEMGADHVGVVTTVSLSSYVHDTVIQRKQCDDTFPKI